MIKTLYIKNFILIDELTLEFSNGFNVLLGETGAGKSIIIKAIDVCLGGKCSKELLKDDTKHALVEITFDDNEELVISREISTTGTKCRINGALVNLDSIKEERERLIDIHTQFQTYNYIQQKFHIELLDSYIKSKEKDFETLLIKQKEENSKLIDAKKKLEKILNDDSSNKDRIEFLKFQTDEIEKAEIKENEEEELNQESEVLSNVLELKELSYSSFFALSGQDDSINDALSKIGCNISKIKDFDPSFKDTEEAFFGALENLRDVAYTLRNYSESLQDNPERLNEIGERLELIQTLKRKYGDIFETYEKLKKELEALEKETVSVGELEEEIKALEKSVNENCAKLSEKRTVYSKELSGIITEELKKLEFDCPVFEIKVEDCSINSKGKDYVEFMITTNAAKSLAPLVKTASGGEISRVMLAMKTVFASVDKVQTVIFDEIDTGISGKTSVSVASEIFELSRSVQVFAITHQPIIASKADYAFWISETQSENDTKVEAKILDTDGKIKALAQMSSGNLDEKSISFAKELLLNDFRF